MIAPETYAIAIVTFVIGFCAGLASLSFFERRYDRSCDRFDRQ